MLGKVAKHGVDARLQLVQAGTEMKARRLSGSFEYLVSMLQWNIDVALNELREMDVTHLGGVHPTEARHLLAHHCRFDGFRSEEHTSELQSLMRISYAVF